MNREFGAPVSLNVLNASLDDVMRDVVRVDLSHRPFARAGRLIVIRHGSNRARAVARGPANVGKTAIALDAATRKRLGVKLDERANFQFAEAGLWDEILWAWGATDAMPRIAARLGVISILLGFVGLILGVVSLIVAFA